MKAREKERADFVREERERVRMVIVTAIKIPMGVIPIVYVTLLLGRSSVI